jgi:hypothetical protein
MEKRSRPQVIKARRWVSLIILPPLMLFVLGCAIPGSTRTGQKHSGPPACSQPETPQPESQIERLAQDLVKLLGHPDPEAGLLAATAVRGAKSLAGQYEVQTSGKFHNFMILVGIRSRGLCCHWTRDLLDLLKPLELQNFQFSWAVSEYATNQEHSSIVVTVADKPFASGIVLDAWRNGGDLFWARVAADTYEWHPHPADDGSGMIICEVDQKN